MSLLYIIFIIVPAVKITKKDTNGYFFLFTERKVTNIFLNLHQNCFLNNIKTTLREHIATTTCLYCNFQFANRRQTFVYLLCERYFLCN
jgi:hypothetical protein